MVKTRRGAVAGKPNTYTLKDGSSSQGLELELDQGSELELDENQLDQDLDLERDQDLDQFVNDVSGLGFGFVNDVSVSVPPKLYYYCRDEMNQINLDMISR